MSQKVYTYKTLKKIVEKSTRDSTAFALEAVMASLVDRFKFKSEDLELLMKDTAFATKHKDSLSRHDFKDIIERHIGEVV